MEEELVATKRKVEELGVELNKAKRECSEMVAEKKSLATQRASLRKIRGCQIGWPQNQGDRRYAIFSPAGPLVADTLPNWG